MRADQVWRLLPWNPYTDLACPFFLSPGRQARRAGPTNSRRTAEVMITTDSGLQYEDLHEGSGPAAQAGNTVEVHYTGWLKDGPKFDSSHDRHRPFSFRLGAGKVIKGWDEGVAGMKVG